MVTLLNRAVTLLNSGAALLNKSITEISSIQQLSLGLVVGLSQCPLPPDHCSNGCSSSVFELLLSLLVRNYRTKPSTKHQQ